MLTGEVVTASAVARQVLLPVLDMVTLVASEVDQENAGTGAVELSV